MSSQPTTYLQATTEELRQLLGEEFVAANEDGSISLLPKDTQQVSSILQYASRKKLTVAPCGGGSKQRWGGGDPPHIRLSLSRLNRVIEHPWQDLTCTVQAGCTWALLQQTLVRHGQFVALDPLFVERATVGGILATNDSGSLRQRYGSLRDLVIGMTLVLADGTIARTGGKVVKNVAGYDLSKLMTGSLGTLAVITEANFRLHALPQHVRTFTVKAPDAVRLAHLLGTIRGSHLLTQALQIRRDSSGVNLDVSLMAHPAARQDELLLQMMQAEGLELREASDASCFARDYLLANEATFVRASTLPSDVCGFSDELQRIAAKIEVTSISQAVGLHDVMFNGSGDEIQTIIRHLRGMRSASVKVLQRGQGVDVPAFQIPAPELSVMEAVKRNFDPDSLLSPGRYFAP